MTTAPVQARKQPGKGSRREPLLWGMLGIGTLLALFEIIPRFGLINSRYVPPLSDVLAALGGQLTDAGFWTALGSTILGWLLGLAIASVLGVVGGVVVASIPLVNRMLSSTIEFLRPIPSVALVPIAALLFGTTMQATLLLVVFASFWQVLVQVMYGVRDIDRVALDTARTYRLGTFWTVRRVVWPSIMPYVVIGIRLAAAVALILEITGELVIGSPGIGKLIVIAQSSVATSTMYALVLVAALLGVLVNVGTRHIEHRVLFWHASVRSEGA
ncbi:nitrate ABC transporter permease [Zafaria cholistanensis]|uniref:Nitrate ABC transporter permease n=1 Tax=Zafaria cholistanensis TaxID=1682741 RepID=A0A5A7NR47_9MICC|nr:ABC transporter permease [Zafaria cholistanensis]GER23189.1 nitrate ABC transporter permease [Zafaria cholistanensis]